MKLLASFMSDPSSKDVVILQMQEWMSDASASSNSTMQLVAAIIYMHDDNIKEAIKTVHHGVTMEQYAL